MIFAEGAIPLCNGALKIVMEGGVDVLPASATYRLPLESTATPSGVVSPVKVSIGVRLLENGVGEGVGDGDTLGLTDGEGEGDGVGVGLGDAVGDPLGVGEGLGTEYTVTEPAPLLPT